MNVNLFNKLSVNVDETCSFPPVEFSAARLQAEFAQRVKAAEADSQSSAFFWTRREG